ncbi:MAG: DNA helicase UvrD [Herbiconiux sp.]|uniref:UvrD-helicase domain-containing protein n=1 Tax=Herbiconiux sp. TaxID=1871186 RepID=UPI00121D1E26|nr:UvrD-helicase domain-containing protein [Herbiconiux sp.]TAJ46887.1 MAG: DNA helicase UvrD [Herbiconiux sp.]
MSPSLRDRPARDRIAFDTASSLFVEAGAGSGKTKSLVDRVTTLVDREAVPLGCIAAVTFTEKAGAELRDRLRVAFETMLQDESVTDAARRLRLESALDDLDSAAFGTLHSFAQRILSMFPVEAGLPPLIEVLDEVGSSVAFESRWTEVRRALLDDEVLADAVELALSAGISLDHLRSLAMALGNDWDLIESHVLAHPAPAMTVPPLTHFGEEAVALAWRRADCRDPADKYLPNLDRFEVWGQRLIAATSRAEVFGVLADVGDLKTSYGQAGNWRTPLADLRRDCIDLKDRVATEYQRIADAALRPLVRWIAQAVLDSASARRAEGALEFHDLLVLARDVVRRDASVRRELQATFPHLLLDEFQDTDPIQLELALRIAAGESGDADDWRDIVVPAGSVFVVGDPKQSIYRFRRASIETYLEASQHIGEQVQLTTNFRTVPSVLGWVNAVFSELIVETDNSQPRYQPLDEHRSEDGLSGPAVSILGAEEHDKDTNAAELREFEATDVAATITQALHEGWTVRDGDLWRPIARGDITVLVPARTSLPFLEEALDAAGLAYRAESSSLVYQGAEVRDLMMTARAIADPSDELACVSALRSALFGCGDDDLWTYKRAGGRISLDWSVPPELVQHPVGRALGALRGIRNQARWLPPGEILDRIIADRRMLEVAESFAGPRGREQWRRLRFVVDQARAWSGVQHGGLRAYLAWASRQADDSSRVIEAVLPETDVDVIRIMTVHAAKGLEFPLVVLSGMSSQPSTSRGVQLLWTDGDYAVKLNSRMQTNDFDAVQPLDEQMDAFERKRLLYVAATRATDHLVVSLHRKVGKTQTNARLLVEAGAVDAFGAAVLEPTAVPFAMSTAVPVDPPLTFAEWSAGVHAARVLGARAASQSASGLEGSDPQIALQADPGLAEQIAGAAKGARDLETAPWLKGRYGDLVGRAVHGVLQSVDLALPTGLEALVAAQCVAEGVTEHADVVLSYVLSALGLPIVQRAGGLQHWKESFVGTVEDGTVLEGYVDLIVREEDGTLVVVDYKTDTVPDAAIPVRAAYYAPQLLAYGRALIAATGASTRLVLAFLDGGGGPAREYEVRIVDGEEGEC